MILNKTRFVNFLLLVVLAPTVGATSVYITDKLNIGLHEDKTLASPIAVVLPSGTQLQLVKKQGNLSFVTSSDGVSGWIDNSYLMADPPAGARLQTLAARNSALEKQLQSLQAGGQGSSGDATQLAALTSKNQDLQQQLKTERLKTGEMQVSITELKQRLGSNKDTDTLYKEIDALKASNKDLQVKLTNAMANNTTEVAGTAPATTANHLNFGWKRLVIIMVLLLVFGLSLGVYLMDFLNRRRHGGFRI